MNGMRSTRAKPPPSYQWRAMGRISAADAEAEPVISRLFPPDAIGVTLQARAGMSRPLKTRQSRPLDK